MRYWSPWDEQLLRALRGEFRSYAPSIKFDRGSEGGVAVMHHESEVGLWTAASRHKYRYVPTDDGPATAAPCDIMDVIPVSHTLFSHLLESAQRRQG